MREILFRAKRVDNGEWVEGYLFDDGMAEVEHYFVGRIVVEPYKGTACDDWDITGIDFCEVNPETLCQFTGFTDKHGQRIWENDIVEFEDVGEEGYEYEEGFDFTNTATVVWHNGRFEMSDFASSNSAVLEEMNNCHEDFILVFQECEVIGNVFDDKHLLDLMRKS